MKELPNTATIRGRGRRRRLPPPPPPPGRRRRRRRRLERRPQQPGCEGPGGSRPPRRNDTRIEQTRGEHRLSQCVELLDRRTRIIVLLLDGFESVDVVSQRQGAEISRLAAILVVRHVRPGGGIEGGRDPAAQRRRLGAPSAIDASGGGPAVVGGGRDAAGRDDGQIMHMEANGGKEPRRNEDREGDAEPPTRGRHSPSSRRVYGIYIYNATSLPSPASSPSSRPVPSSLARPSSMVPYYAPSQPQANAARVSREE